MYPFIQQMYVGLKTDFLKAHASLQLKGTDFEIKK
jgi:hypothetical protein